MGALAASGLAAFAQQEPLLPPRWTEQASGPATEWASPVAGAMLPLEWTVQARASAGAALSLQVESAPGTPPLLDVQFRLQEHNRAAVSARASGARMETELLSDRVWSRIEEPTGSVAYGWRYARVKNLWDERDRREIGASQGALTPFAEKSFVFRLVLAGGRRQVWLDDRLVAESAGPNPRAAGLKLRFQNAAVEAMVLAPAPAREAFLPLPLTAYSHSPARPPRADPGERIEEGSPAVPFWLPPEGAVDLDLGETFFRYRLTDGSGPDASYVNAVCAWPGAFSVDPAALTFRVPHRPWQTVWLLAWMDDEHASVPAGVFRFFRNRAGHAATTPFEISEEAIRSGRVIRLDRTTAGGRPLYAIRVPVETDAMAGLADAAGRFVEFELSKPLALFRSYPDPIYYGYHPAGPPSSIHVVGVTLEEAAFDYDVQPDRLGHVFVRPEKAGYTVVVTNRTDRPLEARVSLAAESFGERGTGGGSYSGLLAAASGPLAPGKEARFRLELDPARNGWHGLKVRVEAGGVARSNTLSLVMLPPDIRSGGFATNETRFGIWTLWGHYLPMRAGQFGRNEEWLGVMRKLGLRGGGGHGAFIKTESMKKHGFLPKGPHTFVDVFHRLNENDPAAMRAMVSNELAQVAEDYGSFPKSTYFYGGEWHLGREIQYAPWPRYTGDGDRPLTPDEQARADRHIKIFTAIGTAMRETYPRTRLILQWGAPLGTLAYMKAGLQKDLADLYGMDAPMFELIPENPAGVGSIQRLWGFRQEAERLGWPRLPIAWCEGPFFPTCAGALTEEQQAWYQVRYWLAGLAYGVEDFQAGVVDFDGGNYYGAEHYGAGIFHRTPLANPKPAVAAVATATAMLCGADPAGFVDLGVPTTFCMAFRLSGTNVMRYALWRVAGKAAVRLAITGGKPVVTDSMGNAEELRAERGVVVVPVDESPVWLTGVDRITEGRVEAPVYREQPGPWTQPLAAFESRYWKYDPAPDKTVTNRHFAVRRIPDPSLGVEFMKGFEGHPFVAAVSLPAGPMDKALAQRTGVLKAKRPIAIPGVPSALGVWVRGNSSWGRIIYRIKDAQGELWSSTGTKDDWNCDDPYGWSYVNFEGWRYLRFPLPGNAPWDGARAPDSVWWGSLGGNGVPEPPYALESIVLEARNEAPVAGEMVPVKDRTYHLSGLVAEYARKGDDQLDALRKLRKSMPLPDWKGPADNLIARLAETGEGEAPDLGRFDEPHHFNDGRRMIIRFGAKPGLTYNLYLSRYAGGEGAELLKANVTDGLLVTGLRPETVMYLFLTSVGPDKKESKPSKPVRLVTRDNFAEK
jgi:hypothetical protein